MEDTKHAYQLTSSSVLSLACCQQCAVVATRMLLSTSGNACNILKMLILHGYTDTHTGVDMQFEAAHRSRSYICANLQEAWG